MFKRFLKKRPAKKAKGKRKRRGKKPVRKLVKTTPASRYRLPTYNSMSFKPWMTMVPLISRFKAKFEFFQNYVIPPADTFLKQFRCNSIYDPEYTSGIGQTSVGDYEKMASFYQKYRVLGSTIKATIASAGASGVLSSSSNNFGYAVVPGGSAISGSDFEWQSIKTQRFAKWRDINTYSQMKDMTIRHKASSALMFGVNEIEIVTSAQHAAAFGSNPLAQSFWNIYMCNHNTESQPTGASVSFGLGIEIIYEVELSIPKLVSTPIGTTITGDTGPSQGPTGAYGYSVSGITQISVTGSTGIGGIIA